MVCGATSSGNVIRKDKGTGKVIPVHTMKTHGGPVGTTLHTLPSTLEEVVTFTTRKFYYRDEFPVLDEQEGGWAPEQVWLLWRRKIS
jgi:hypothetical protein